MSGNMKRMPDISRWTAVLATSFLAISFLALTGAKCSAQPAVQPKPNSVPGKAYLIELHFADLPGPIAEIAGSAVYRVANLECIPVDKERAAGGVRLAPEHSVEIVWERQADGSFSAAVRENPLLDENMFGLGVCRWELQTTSVGFRSPVTKFVGGMGAEQLRAGETVTQHFLVADFHQPPGVIEWVFGEKAGHYLEKMGPQFTLRISSRKSD